MLRKFFLLLLLAAIISSGAGCRRRTSQVAEGYKDPYPLPADPMVVEAPTVGKYGGRFVFGETNKYVLPFLGLFSGGALSESPKSNTR